MGTRAGGDVFGQGSPHGSDQPSDSPSRGSSSFLRLVARRGLAARMIVASGLLALIVGGAFAAMLRAVDRERDALELSRHSERVLVAARRLEQLVIDLDTGERGFLLTDSARFLQPWTTDQAR